MKNFDGVNRTRAKLASVPFFNLSRKHRVKSTVTHKAVPF